MSRLLACGAAGLLVAIAPLGAQSTSPFENTRHSIWIVYGGDHAVARRVGLVFDSQLRLTQDADHQQQLLVRPGVSYAISSQIKLSAGSALMASRDDGSDPLSQQQPEHRAWFSAQFAHAVGPISFAHRYRGEHRWLPGVQIDDAGAPLGETYVTAERMRYGLRATIPLATPGRARDVYLAASDEVFASFGGYAGDMEVDQNRATLAFGFRPRASLRLEVGYMLQSSGTNGRLDEQNHTLQIGAFSTAPVRRR